MSNKTTKKIKKVKQQKTRKGAESFKRFVDFMYENPKLIKEFPKKIIFSDEAVKLEFA